VVPPADDAELLRAMHAASRAVVWQPHRGTSKVGTARACRVLHAIDNNKQTKLSTQTSRVKSQRRYRNHLRHGLTNYFFRLQLQDDSIPRPYIAVLRPFTVTSLAHLHRKDAIFDNGTRRLNAS
jgi:hypothetical protein